MKTDEEVYKILIRDKNRRQVTAIAVLAFLLLCFIIAAIILSVLYFGSGEVIKQTEIQVYTDGGSIQNTNIDSYQSAANGDVNITSVNEPMVALISVCVVIFVVGVICLLHYIKKQR